MNNGTQYEYYRNYTNMMLYPADTTDKRNDISQLKIIVSIGTMFVVRLHILRILPIYKYIRKDNDNVLDLKIAFR